MLESDEVLVVGGVEKKDRGQEEWHRFGGARIFRLDCRTHEVVQHQEYVSPPSVCPDENPSILFKSGTRDGGRLYLCTQTEVLIMRADDFSIEHIWTHACLNDVHHVMPDGEGGFYVVVTGLDLVIRVDSAGQIVNEWSAVPGELPFARFDRDTDYRKIASTKPHTTHPNFVFRLDGDLWVTRFHTRDALCLSANRQSLAIDVEGPHDGVIFEGKVYFTTVDGHVVVIDPKFPETKQVFNLNTFGRFGGPLGWCRGLKVLDNDRVLVGFSRLRPTKFSENLRWVRSQISALQNYRRVHIPPAPTSIRCFNLNKGSQEYWVNLERYGMNVIFSVL